MSNHPKVDALRKDSATVAIISKLVDEPNTGGRSHSRGTVVPPNDALLNKVSRLNANNVTDAKSIFQLLPDMELASQILIASIISPNDMISTDVTIALSDSLFSNEIASPLLRIVTDFFENDYKIKKQLPTILRDILFERGSYPLVVLPESTIDTAINSHTSVTLESVRELFDEKTGTVRTIGLLGNSSSSVKEDKVSQRSSKASTVTLESLMHIGSTSYAEYNPSLGVGEGDQGTFIKVVDDPSVLKLPMLKSKIVHERVMSRFKIKSMGMESRQGYDSDDEIKKMERILYRPRPYRHTPAQALTVPERGRNNTQGHPLVMLLPSESIIPVHVPGDVSAHVGYFVLLDTDGNPLNLATRTDHYGDLVNSLALKPDQVRNMLQTNFPAATTGRFEGENAQEFAELNRTYNSIIEQDLLQRLRNGIYGEGVEIAHREEIFRIMLARSMAKKQTQLLYIPKELMVYMAFDYNEYGVGKSLVEETKILASLRIMMLFANTMAGIKNSVGHTGLEITLDPEDAEPATTVEILMNEYAHTRQMAYPIGTAAPLEIINFLQRAAVDVHVSGNPRYPETRAEVVDKQANRTLVDTGLDEELKKRHTMSFGLNPETVDLGMNVEFATSITSSNILLAKRSKLYQDKLTPFLEDLISKVTLYSEVLMNEMRDVITEHKEDVPQYIVDMFGNTDAVDPDVVIAEFLKSIRVKLPEADPVKLENQLSAYETYKQALDNCLEAYFSPDFLTGTELGKSTEDIQSVIAAIRAHFLRRWQRNNNMLPELSDLISKDEADDPILDLLDTHQNFVEDITRSVGSYMMTLKESVAKNDKVLDDKQAQLEKRYGDIEEYSSSDEEPSDEGTSEEDPFAMDDEDLMPSEGEFEDTQDTEEPEIDEADDTETPEE